MITCRFAPAPTGLLHLGHVVNAIHVWGITRALGGRVLLRIEDHDRARSRPRFEAAILDDLDWLGFVPDDPSTETFRGGACSGRQSDRERIYAEAFDQLYARGLLYACECSRNDIASATVQDGPELRYPGTCASKQLSGRTGLGFRVRLSPSMESFDDLRHGPQVQCPSEQCGDMLVRDRDGLWTYQFAVTVDDFVQDVTLVVRGDDLLASTGRQILLARLLGRSRPPEFLHHALIMKSPTQKLSKADRDTSVQDLRTAGWNPAAVIGKAARACGLVDAEVAVTAEQVPSLVAARYRELLERLG